MTGSEYADDQKHLEAAIALALRGNRAAAGLELAHITAQGVDRTYRLWQALAETAVYPIRNEPPGGPRYGFAAFDKYGPTDVDDAPPAVRLALRFLVAQATRDRDTLHALFGAPLEHGDTAVMDEVLGLLLDAATESARQQAAQRGTFDGP